MLTVPAIEYLRLAQQVGVSVEDAFRISSEGNADQEAPLGSGDSLHDDYIAWCMPAHDSLRPRQRGCGFIRSRDGGLVYTACPTDPEHH